MGGHAKLFTDALSNEGLQRQAQFKAHTKLVNDAVRTEALERQEQFAAHLKSINEAVNAEALQRQEQLKAQDLKLEEIALIQKDTRQLDELTRLLDMHHKRLEMGEMANEALRENQSAVLAEADQRWK